MARRATSQVRVRCWSMLVLALGVVGAMAAPSHALTLALPSTEDAELASPSAQRRARTVAALPDRPDIVMLVVDDLGDMDHRVLERLPTIRKRFLATGIEFTEYIGNDPLCCPGRATLLTGQRSGDHGVVINDPAPFDPGVTIATELSARGYHTLFAGKYFNHPGSIVDRTPPGWDHFLFGEGYYEQTWYRDGGAVRLGNDARDYSTDVIRRHVTRWIRGAPDRPLLVWLAPFAVHGGKDEFGLKSSGEPVPARRHRGDTRCAGIEPWRTPANGESDRTDKPAYVQALTTTGAKGKALTTICEAMLSVDDLLAATTRALADRGRTNVLYVLVSDNGMAMGAHGWPTKYAPYAVPMPFFLQWTAGLGTTPREIDDTATSTDIAPTLCAVAGCRMGPFPNGRPVSGISLVPLLTGAARPSRQVIPIEHHRRMAALGMPAWRGLQTTARHALGRWSYVRYATGEVELYDLARDPWQLDNRAEAAGSASVRRTLEALCDTLHPGAS